jgi:hypothetical protein
VGIRSNTPVFCDQLGARSAVLQWSGSGSAFSASCPALALTLATRVEVPGLSRLLPGGGGGRSDLFDAHARRTGWTARSWTRARSRLPRPASRPLHMYHLPVPRLSWAAPTVEPVAERPAVTRAVSPGHRDAMASCRLPGVLGRISRDIRQGVPRVRKDCRL